MNDKIHLRAVSPEDAHTSWRWRNQEEVRNGFSGHPFPVNYEQEREWIDKLLSPGSGTTAFGIVENSSGQLVGMTFLKNINHLHRQAEFAILIDKEYTGKGYGKEACAKTLDFAFQDLGLHRVFLKVRKDNAAAIAIYNACGFKTEGTLRDDVFKQGQFRDVLLMAVLSTEINIH